MGCSVQLHYPYSVQRYNLSISLKNSDIAQNITQVT